MVDLVVKVVDLVVTNLLHVDGVTRATKDETGLHSLCETFCLHADLLLLFLGEIDKVVVLCTDKERNGGLVETSPLAIPFFDGVESALTGKIEHEENGDCIVADQRQHIDKLALAAEVPDGECYFRISNADCLFHKVDTCVA